MANIKKTILQKKLSGVLYDIYVKTSADMVDFKDTTVAVALQKAIDDIAAIIADNGTIDTKVNAATQSLYNQIMGIADEEGTTINEAYDTLKEVAEYLTAHGDVVTGFTTRISDLEAAVGDDTTGLIKDVADIQNALDELNTNGVSFVEASETNGNIKVNGEELTVYTHPESHPATMITEDDDHMFVTAAQLETFSAAAAINLVSEVPANASENDLFFVEITE